MRVLSRAKWLATAAFPVLAAHHAPALPAPVASSAAVEEITVVGTNPLPGSGVDCNSIPVDTQVLDSPNLTRGSERSIIPSKITLLSPLAYSPELNQVENVWYYLRGNWLSHRV